MCVQQMTTINIRISLFGRFMAHLPTKYNECLFPCFFELNGQITLFNTVRLWYFRYISSFAFLLFMGRSVIDGKEGAPNVF